jgi:hypothetical protein
MDEYVFRQSVLRQARKEVTGRRPKNYRNWPCA